MRSRCLHAVAEADEGTFAALPRARQFGPWVGVLEHDGVGLARRCMSWAMATRTGCALGAEDAAGEGVADALVDAVFERIS